MSTIRTWAQRWNIPYAAVADLERAMGIAANFAAMDVTTEGAEYSEAYQQSLVRLEAGRLGIRLWRNNSGAFKSDTGQLVRYGLANDSAQLNKVLKSPDLVGWRKRVITSEMVGSVIGQACMREMKHATWTYKGDAHERAQLAFIELAVADGCDAAFAVGPGTL